MRCRFALAAFVAMTTWAPTSRAQQPFWRESGRPSLFGGGSGPQNLTFTPIDTSNTVVPLPFAKPPFSVWNYMPRISLPSFSSFRSQSSSSGASTSNPFMPPAPANSVVR